MKTSKSSILKKGVASVCSAAMAVALVPAFAGGAIAAEDTGANAATDTGANAEAPAALTINVENTARNLKSSVSYTQEQLDAMASTTPSYYLTAASGGTVYESAKTISYSKLFEEVGGLRPGAQVTFETWNSDKTGTEPYTKANLSYEDLTEPEFYYPNYVPTADKDRNTAQAVETEPGLSLSLKSAKIGSDQKAFEALNNVADDISTPRWMMNPTNEDYTTNSLSVQSKSGVNPTGGNVTPGSSTPSSVAVINVTYSDYFDIYAEDTHTGKLTIAKSYKTAEDLAKDATTGTADYLYNAKGATVYEATSYIPASKLFSGVTGWGKGATLSFYTTDKAGTGIEEYTKMEDANKTYEAVTGTRYFYPNYSSADPKNVTGATPVEASLALSYKSAKVGEEQTAKQALNNVTDEAGARWFTGIDQSVYTTDDTAEGGNLLMGRNTPSGVVAIKVSYDSSKQTPATPTTKKAANTLKLGASKVTVKKGKSKKVAVKSAKGTVKVSTSNKKVAKVSYSKKAKKVTIKAVKKGRATITVQAAGTSKYKAGKKTIKVTVKK